MLEQLQPILAKLTEYGSLIASGLLIMFGGMIAILVLYRIVAKIIRPNGTYSRVIKVAFGAIYAMILVLTIMLAAEKIGFDTSGLAGIAILLVMVAAVIVFFLIPFLPRLPFVPGDMVDVRGTMGIVEAITAYQTVIRTFDGHVVFIPSPMIMASPIINYSLLPNRRIQLDLEMNATDDITRAKTLTLELMNTHEKVLDDPAPSAFFTGIDDGKITLVAYCWVENADWFGTRDALFAQVAQAFSQEAHVALAIPKREITQSTPL
ncbi:MAG: mechanosensitive ion channel domain-containing protein [Halioglobus sp.]